LPRVIASILSISASGKASGVDTKLGQLFSNARHSGLWPTASAVHRSALTKARAHVSWQAFEELFYRAVSLAQELITPQPWHLWHGMSVYAVDGSQFALPASDQVRKAFDPRSGLEYSGSGHFPQALVCTVVDVLRRVPVARVLAPADSNERSLAQQMLPRISAQGVLMFDRGYPSLELLQCLNDRYQGYFLMRCPAQGTFAVVKRFINSARLQDEVWLAREGALTTTPSMQQRYNTGAMRLRIIRLQAPDGTLSVLLTNLLGRNCFPAEQIIQLYHKRWEVETYYRDEKESLQVQQFHSRTDNGVRQELYAVATMAVIARMLMALATDDNAVAPLPEPQFKHAVLSLAHASALLVNEQPCVALQLFAELLDEIGRVKYYRPRQPRPSQPRVCKQPTNKWICARAQRMAHA
jgi:hypothetical protein